MSSSAVYCMHMPWEVPRGVCALHGCLRFSYRFAVNSWEAQVSAPKHILPLTSLPAVPSFTFKGVCSFFLASLLLCCWIYHQLKCSQTWKTYISWIGHEVVPHWPTGMHLGVTVDVDGFAVPGWLGPAQPSQTQSLLLGSADRWLSGRRLGRDGLGSMVIPSNCFAVTGSFTSGGFFRGVVWVSMHDMTAVLFVPVWPVASNLLNVLYNLLKGPIVKCIGCIGPIGVVFLQEFAIVQLIFFWHAVTTNLA